MAATGVAVPCLSSVKVVVVIEVAFIASEKVTVGLTLREIPVAPSAGVRPVIVGGVVSPPPVPHSIRAEAQSAWS